MVKENKRPDHPGGFDFVKEFGRLNRAVGQMEGIKKMISESRDCFEILSQLRAVRSAVRAIEANILKSYLQYCVLQCFNSEEERQTRINEIRELFDRFHEI